MDYLIVSAATEGSRYVACLDIQRQRHGSDFLGLVVPDRGSWAENTKIKPDAILAAFEKCPNVLWIDSDCEVAAPEKFSTANFDVGIIDNIVTSHKCRMSAAFILFRDTPKTRLFLERWKENNGKYSKDHPAFKATIQQSDDVRVENVTPWLRGRHKVNVYAPDRQVAVSLKRKGHGLRALIMPCRPQSVDRGWPAHMKEGITACGDTASFSMNYQNGYDAYLFWGMKRAHGRQALGAGNRCVIIERAYLGDRFRWHAVGLNGLNGRADFRNDDVPDDRWQQHWAGQVKPWRDGGDYALVIGQVFGDASLNGTNPYEWAQHQVKQAKKRFARVYFRPHPLCKRRVPIDAEELPGTEAEALSGAAVVITHSSNMGVLAAMEGIPVVATYEGSMVYKIASHDLSDGLIRPDRSDWGRRIAYAQWTPEELADGSAWRHISRGWK
jgi:hypothetical protein